MREVVATTSWEPDMNHGTWHRHSKRLIGPVTYVQRVNDQPTGLFFVVSRQRYWWIWGLIETRRWPLIGRLARRLLARIKVEYHWTWLHNRKLGEA